MAIDIHRLIQEAQSSTDDIRNSAEYRLLQLCDEDASELFSLFINVATNDNELLATRQFALFALRKLITMYWSPGFESYRATSTIDDSTKRIVRESLLRLSLENSLLPKLRNAASYCVVQICAVDFPDQWPHLLQSIYDAISNMSLPAMSLLNEIYDDIVSEEMFFEGGLGSETIGVVLQALREPTSDRDTIALALDLLHSCLLQLLAVSSRSTGRRKELAVQYIEEFLKIWEHFLRQQSITQDPDYITIKSKIYEGLALLKSEFPKKLFPANFCPPFKHVALNDLEEAATFYMPLSDSFSDEKGLDLINGYAVHLLEFVTASCDMHFETNELGRIIAAVECLCRYNENLAETWLADFNSFISDEVGLAANFTIRDQAAELLSILNNEGFLVASKCIVQEISYLPERKISWKSEEALLFLLQSILANECPVTDELSERMFQVVLFLSRALDDKATNEFVRSRIILVLPKILEKYMESFDNIKVLTRDLLTQSLGFATPDSEDVVKASILIAFTYYAYFAELPSVLGFEVCEQIQIKTLKLIDQIAQDAEGDTHGLLLEALSHLIDCNVHGSLSDGIIQSEFHLVFTISAKEPSNIQTVVESQTCLRKLLCNLDVKSFTKYAEDYLPSFVKVIEGSKQAGYEYSSILSLSLQFLDAFMTKKPSENCLPAPIGNFVFQPLKDLLCQSNDDEILRQATSAFSHLVHNTDSSAISPRLEEVVQVADRLLSLNVSDIAAQNSGSLIVTLFTKFPHEIQSLVPLILEAVTGKLIQTKSMATSQNLLFVFCYLACLDAQQTVDFLSGIVIEDGETTALDLILSKWLDSFEEIRGETRAKENVLALSKLFFLKDSRLAKMKVNGDIIPYQGDQIVTRSKAKEMPDRYEVISFYAKIIKLFVSELNAQDRQDSSRYIKDAINDSMDDLDPSASAGDEDDWEDVGDVLDYETLQEYVDDSDAGEDDIDEEAYEEIAGIYDLKKSIRDMLLDFFKEVTTKNVNGFNDIYNSLTEQERRTLSEHLL